MKFALSMTSISNMVHADLFMGLYIWHLLSNQARLNNIYVKRPRERKYGIT